MFSLEEALLLIDGSGKVVNLNWRDSAICMRYLSHLEADKTHKMSDSDSILLLCLILESEGR